MNRSNVSLFAVATIFAASLPTAAEDRDKTITIQVSAVVANDGSFAGTFSMDGAITEAGSFDGVAMEVTRSGNKVFTVGDKKLHLQGGDLYLHFETEVTFVGPNADNEEGRWTITGGTGNYAHSTGGGSEFILMDYVTGNVQTVEHGTIDVD